MFNAEVSDTAHTGLDIATRCLVISLDKGQTIWIIGNVTQSYCNLYQMSSFKEFYLSPTHGIKYARSIYSPLPGTARPSLQNVGLKNITFDTNTAYVVVPYAGIYYISITTTNLNSGSAVNFRVHINITGILIHILKYLHAKV